MPAARQPGFASVVATWAGVLLVLAGLDWLLFSHGLLWRAHPKFERSLVGGNWSLLWNAAKTIETTDDPRTAFVVGSSVVYSGVDEGIVNRALADEPDPPRLVRLTTFGGSATDSALLAWHALDVRPWLVVYAAAPRDFLRTAATDTATTRLFADASVDLPALPRETLDEELDAWVRRVWRLYRYRFFVRTVLDGELTRLAAALAPRAAAAAEPPPLPSEAFTWFLPGLITPAGWERWTRWRETGSFDDYTAWLTTNNPAILDIYRTITLANYGPDADNPQVASLRWIADATRKRGARFLIVYTPENPVFRRPEAAPFFDAALSDAYARLFAAEAARVGGRFVDLRHALPPEQFSDLVHLNLRGARTMSGLMAGVIAEEWSARAARAAR